MKKLLRYPVLASLFFSTNGRSGGRRRLRQKRSSLGAMENLESRALMVGDVSGIVFEDFNGNGIDDGPDDGLAGWTVFADLNRDGRFTAGEPRTVTDVNGKYTLTGVPAGATQVYDIPQDGYAPSPGFSDRVTVTVRDGRRVKADFPNMLPPVTTGRIAGTVFEDDNENLISESGEDGLANWTLFIDTNGDGSLTPGEPTAITDIEGDYAFENVAPGPATVYEIPQGGFGPIVGGLFPVEGASDHRQVTVVAGATARIDFANLIPPIGTLQGIVWNDDNGDGIRNADESPVAGRTVYLDLNANDLQDVAEPVRVTDANGRYAFTQIHTGTYRVMEKRPDGWISTEGRPSTVTATVFRNGTTNADFWELMPRSGSIQGTAWNDLNGNGLRDLSEPALVGWQVFRDLNFDGVLDAGEPATTTDATGNYAFADVPYGNVSIREIVPSGWLATTPPGGVANFRLLNGETRSGLLLGNRENVADVVGSVWEDTNGDGLRGATEGPLADWTVFADLNNDGQLNADEPSATTNSSGAYVLSRLPVGTYRVTQVRPEGWINSVGNPSAVTTTLTIGGTKSIDFYNLQPIPGSVSGLVWNDVNSNGIQEGDEIGLADWLVFADLNNNGVADPQEPQATTDGSGLYTLVDVPYGNTTIRTNVTVGYTATTPSARTMLLLNGENRTNVHFGLHETAEFTITGHVFKDVDGDGLRSEGEPGISGVPVYLDINNNGQWDLGEALTNSSADLFYTPDINELGTYSFTHLARGTYQVREIVPESLSRTPISAQLQTVNLGPSSATEVNFANLYRNNEIHGFVFDDTNRDGVHDASEHGRGGVSIYIDLDRDDLYDVDEPRTTTGDDGSYSFTGLTPGAYVVREDLNESLPPRTYPTTGGGTLWPAGVSRASVGNVTPGSITTSLADGETYSQTVTLTLPEAGSLTNLVDVFLLFDDTGSFTTNSPIVRAAFPTIIESLQGSLPGIDLGFGVGRFEEYGSFAGENALGRPFILNQPIVASTTPGFSTAIQSALDRTAPGFGGDASETDIEALYQLVTGRGFDGNNNGTVLDSGPAGLASTQFTPGTSGDVPSFASFTPDPANGILASDGAIGGGGFRTGALPIVLLATDVGFAYQPKGESVIVGAGGLTLPMADLMDASRSSTPFGTGAGIQETITGLNALGALVIGLGTVPEPTLAPRSSLEAISKLTGAINRSTSTIQNGTPDPIAPGDPLYFEISTGFGTTVADGVLNAIQNAVTSVAMDITVRASDPRVQIVNQTGVLSGISSGQTASFDIQFIGDGRPHRFDLEFVRAGTSVVLGSIPVVLGTPVVGEGYGYDEMEDGEIHRSSHFGHYIANVAPTFTSGTDQTVSEDASEQTVLQWATDIVAGPASESMQTVSFVVTNSQPSLFRVQPAISNDGTLTYTPAADAFGTAEVTVLLKDNGGVGPGGSDTSTPVTFTISILPVNDAPVANADEYATAGVTLTIGASLGVLSNDLDSDGDPIVSTIATAPSHGSLTLQADGSFEYRPAAGFSGVDSFQYLVNDGLVDSLPATVLLTVSALNQVPVVTGDFYNLNEDESLDVPVIDGLLANDFDANGDPLAASLLSGPAHGTLTLLADGSFRYSPQANYHGSDSFTYSVSDGTAISEVATVSLVIDAVNDAPLAANDSYTVAEDDLLTVGPAASMLANDSDVDGDMIVARLVTEPAHGVLTFHEDGTFSYQPDANYRGVDSFTYRVSDGTLDSSLATVTIQVVSVNDLPVATGESYSVVEDSPVSVAAPGLLANDLDVDGDVLRAVRVTNPAHGTLTLNANGSFVYVPALNYNGPDSFTYQVSDGTASSSIVTVSFDVAAVNDAPVARTDAYTTSIDVVLSVPASGVLANDSDVEGTPLTATLVAGTSHGTLDFRADGSFVFTPHEGYIGSDAFTYTVSDGVLTSSVTTVNLTVSPPSTKFFVADADRSATFQYAADGSALNNRTLNSGNSKARGIASNADGTIQWVVDGGGAVYVYDNNASLLGQWTTRDVRKPEGVTVWGNDLWLVDPSVDRVYKFTGGANLRSGRVTSSSSFPLHGQNGSSTDLVTNGTHLWVVDDTLAADRIFRYSMAGALDGSWQLSTLNPSPTGITLDPTHVDHLWVVDASTDRVYQYDSATTRVTGTQEPSRSFALAATNTNPQGIADPDPSWQNAADALFAGLDDDDPRF